MCVGDRLGREKPKCSRTRSICARTQTGETPGKAQCSESDAVRLAVRRRHRSCILRRGLLPNGPTSARDLGPPRLQVYAASAGGAKGSVRPFRWRVFLGGRLCSRGGLGPLAGLDRLSEPIALAVHLEDVAAVRQPVQQCIRKVAGPVPARPVFGVRRPRPRQPPLASSPPPC